MALLSVKNGLVSVEKVATELQNADYLTKGLPHEVFHKNRQRVQGWIVYVEGVAQFYADRRDWVTPGHCSERESQDITDSGHARD